MLRHRIDLDRSIVHVAMTDRSDGSFALDEPSTVLAGRRAAVTERPWLALRQVHGRGVVDADHAVARRAEAVPTGDAAVVSEPGVAVSVLTADCAPVVLVSTRGVAVVHAGWKGASSGVIDAAAAALTDRGGVPVATLLGPCIQPGAYEFGETDLAPLVDEFGVDVIGSTSTGRPALDMTRLVQVACARIGWPEPARAPCTSASGYFSHRTRRDNGRQATVAWIERRDRRVGAVS